MEKPIIPVPEGEMGHIPSVPDLDTVDPELRAKHMELVSAANTARIVVHQLVSDNESNLGARVQASVAYQAAGIAVRAFESFHPEVTQGNVSGQNGNGTKPAD